MLQKQPFSMQRNEGGNQPDLQCEEAKQKLASQVPEMC